MEKKNLFLTAIILCILFFVTPASAIPVSYGTATHSTTSWQELTTYNKDGAMTNSYGVFWSVDNGNTWGQETSLYVGQEVQFMFNMHKENVGTHYADFLKAWIDWGQDGSFDSADTVAYGFQELLANETGNIGSWNDPRVTEYTYYSSIFTLSDENIGDLFLRARVTCSESLAKSMGSSSWNNQWYISDDDYKSGFSAVGHLNQGEVEEWQITVSAAPVPEPSTIVLVGLGLLGMGIYGRKMKNIMK